MPGSLCQCPVSVCLCLSPGPLRLDPVVLLLLACDGWEGAALAQLISRMCPRCAPDEAEGYEAGVKPGDASFHVIHMPTPLVAGQQLLVTLGRLREYFLVPHCSASLVTLLGDAGRDPRLALLM